MSDHRPITEQHQWAPVHLHDHLPGGGILKDTRGLLLFVIREADRDAACGIMRVKGDETEPRELFNNMCDEIVRCRGKIAALRWTVTALAILVVMSISLYLVLALMCQGGAA